MKLTFLAFLFTIAASIAYSQSKPAYILYNAKGKKCSYKKMIRKLAKKDIILFGEFHNNPIAHWLELSVSKDLHQSREMVLGAEMFEADNQLALNAYLAITKQITLHWLILPKSKSFHSLPQTFPAGMLHWYPGKDLKHWTLFLKQKKHGWRLYQWSMILPFPDM